MAELWTAHHDAQYPLSPEEETALSLTPRDDYPSLAGCLLLAMPGLPDEAFVGSVVYLTEHTRAGAMGIVVNRPSDISLKALLHRLDLDLVNAEQGAASVMMGGPVHPDRGFVLHEASDPWTSTLQVPNGLALTSSRDVLEAVSRGGGPTHFAVALGYSGWGPGQLESELAANAWLSVTLTDPIQVLSTPSDELFARALSWLGIEPFQLSGSVGHA